MHPSTQTFIRKVEQLVRPMDVGPLHYFQSFTRLMPIALQQYFMKSAETQSPYMGFVVEPYPLFLCFELAEPDRAAALLPKGFELTPTAVFAGEQPRLCGIVASFNAHTSGFWGTRQETYLIATNTRTGLLTWVIIDVQTNTISFDPKSGLSDPNADNAVVTQDAAGNLLVDVAANDGTAQLTATCATVNATPANLDQRLWLEGNLSITYGGPLGDARYQPFSLIFDPLEVETGLNIPLNDLTIHANTLAQGLFSPTPTHALTFPYSQHFVSSSPLSPRTLRTKAELLDAYEAFIKADDYRAFSVKPLERGLALTLIGLGCVSLALLVLVLFS